MTATGPTNARRAAGRVRGPGLSLALFLALATTARAADDRSVAYYEVGGATAAEIRAALDRVGPADAGGARWDGYTAWHLSWHLSFGRDDGACSLERVTTELRVDVTLPRWHAPPDADPDLVRKWHRYVTALEAHEAGHEKLARDAAAAVRRAMGRVDDAADCATVEREANAAAHAALERAYRAEADYDRRTRHGARQGARFP